MATINACCFNWNNQQGTIMILQLTMVFAVYSLLRQLFDFNDVNPWSSMDSWKIGYCFFSSTMEIFLAFFGMCGVKEMKPVLLVPILVYKLFYIVVYTLIITALPVQTFSSSHELIELFKHRFHLSTNPFAAKLSLIRIIFTVIFTSTLVFPMEQLLKLSPVNTALLVYTSYLCFVDVCQMYFVAVICLSLRELVMENKRLEVRRNIIEPISSGNARPPIMDCGINISTANNQLASASQRADENMTIGDELYRQQIVPNTSTAILSLGIN